MDISQQCSACAGQATLLCICSNYPVCKSCATQHVLQTEKVHTFVPIASQAALQAGDDKLTIVRRAQLMRTYKDFIKQEIDSLESFKQTSLTSLQGTSDAITSKINEITGAKLEKFTRDVEIAKSEAHQYVRQTLADQIDTAKHATNILIKNIKTKNASLKRLKCFDSSYDEITYQKQLDRFASFSVNCPTDTMFELSRTTEEYQDWLILLKKRKEEELKKQEKCLVRFSGATSWSVNGPPTLDAFTIKTSVDIWITGLGLGTGNSSGSSAKIQDIEVRSTKSTRGDVLYRHPEIINTTYDGVEGNKFPKVLFTEPVRLTKATDYCIRVCYSSGSSIHSGSGTAYTQSEGVTFTFGSATFTGGDNDNGSSASSGPVRDIYFALAEA